MAKRFGRNRKRDLARAKNEAFRLNVAVNLLRDRILEIERRRPEMVVCKVIDDITFNREVKAVRAVVTPPPVAMQILVDKSTRLGAVDFAGVFRQMAERLKRDVTNELSRQLGECAAELMRKCKGEW